MNSEKKIPETILKKIIELKQLENLLGHIPPDMWTVSELQKRTDPSFLGQDKQQMEAQTERLFHEICEELFQKQFSVSNITSIINQNINYTGGPKYCNDDEVHQSLGSLK